MTVGLRCGPFITAAYALYLLLGIVCLLLPWMAWMESRRYVCKLRAS